MLEKLKHISFEGRRYYVLSIVHINNEAVFQAIEISYKNKELKIEKRDTSNSLKSLFTEDFKKNYPLILYLEGDTIINKVVENKTGYRNSLIFKANPDDFHFYEYHQEPSVFVSIIRKSNLDSYFKELKMLNMDVIHVAFGPFVLANLLPFTKNYQTISTSNYSLNIDDDKIVSYENSTLKQVNYSINGDQLSASEMPLLASFIDYKYPYPSIQFENDFLNTALSEFKYRLLLKKVGIFTLVFFMLALFIGHFVLQHYSTLLAEKQSQYTLSQQTISEVNALKQDIAIKEKILQTSGINHKEYITKYITTIGNSVLEDITITSLTVNPMLKKIKKEEKIGFDLNEIIIVGESNSDKSFNDWMSALKAIEWVKKIDIIDYSRDTNNTDVFTIQIKI